MCQDEIARKRTSGFEWQNEASVVHTVCLNEIK